MADSKSAAPGRAEGETIIEFLTIGRTVKVSAIDFAALREVSMVAPVSTTERQMTDAVLKKLRYILARRKGT
jgi:hypothetical protein